MVTGSVVVSDQEIDNIMQGVVIGNTAQGVLHKLEELELNRDHVLTRWVWELLQNARDAAADQDTSLVASISINEGEVIFRHNGANFKIDEIGHLIYHGSTKIENPETIGRYGSGFLATHLLSPEIEIAGKLNDGREFQFSLRREVGSISALSDSMAQAQSDFKSSLSAATSVSDFTTQFRYKLSDNAVDAVDEGVEALKRCAPFVVAFNHEFSRIDINSPGEEVQFQVIERRQLEDGSLQLITVVQTENGLRKETKILLARCGKTSVAIPVEIDEIPRCLPVGQVPRLFLGFPLIGTEDFSFPGVINSFDFTPSENRDGVYIARNSNNNVANKENQEAVETACGSLIELLKFAASSGWRDTYNLANIPPIPEKYWLNRDWLKATIENLLVNEMRKNPVMLNESGDVVTAEEVELPMAQTAEGVKSLHGLLSGWQGRCDKMPSRQEAVGWANAAKSWANISESEPSSFDEVTDGRKLAEQIQNLTKVPAAPRPTHLLRRLQAALKPDVLGVEWLDQLHEFLVKNGLAEVIREYRIVPSQAGFLRSLQNLHRDDDIDEELKSIADLMDDYKEWKIRRELRDSDLTVVASEIGQGDWDNEYVVGELIKKLKEQSEEAPNENFAQASIRVFAWICDQKRFNLLRDFPVFSEQSDSESRRVIKLVHDSDDEVRTLAPSSAWPEDLQPFSDLFPRRNIIANDFFDAVSCPLVWLALDEEGFCTRNVITKREVNLRTFHPNEPLTEAEHETAECVGVTDITFFSREDIGIMARVRQSQRLARIFWQFLTEWMTAYDATGLEPHEATCVCGESHHYYPAQWLGPLRRNVWVPLGANKRVQVSAQSLADLLRGSGWEPSSLNGNPVAVMLLEAIGITHFDLVRAFVAETEEERRHQDRILTGILDAAAGKMERLNQAQQYIEYLKDDEALPQVIEERQNQRRVVRENQSLGKQVEELVRKSLEKQEFVVRRKPIGSDYVIEHDALEGEEESGIEVEGSNRKWLVEVKATRGQAVRMTEKQANTAREKGNKFLLCVVQLEGDQPNLTVEEVSARMKFVQNIGPLVAPLCDNLSGFRQLEKDITTGDASAVQLIVDAGTVRVQVAAPVWEEDGFQLADLLGKLQGSVKD